MTLRERIADWISGGELTFCKKGWARSVAIAQDRDREIAQGKFDLKFSEAQSREQSHRSYLLQERLTRIAACETPNANATVRRMARIAREAME